MRKLAIFVEGYTEVLFLTKIIEEAAGRANVIVEQRAIRGGSSVARSNSILKAARKATDEKYYVLIVDCGGDQLVKSRIIEEHERLTKNGYSKVIGVRDVRPDFTRADIPRLSRGLKKYIKTSLIPVEFFLAVMEIEAWFLSETSHFSEIHMDLSPELIHVKLGFHPTHDDMSLRDNPTKDIHESYCLVGESYQKGAVKTVDAIDAAAIYMEVKEKFPFLRSLIESIDSFLEDKVIPAT